MPPAPAPPPSLQLSLFDDAPAAAAAAPPLVSPAPPSPPPAPVAAPAPTAFRHPRSQCDIRLGEHLVAYELRRARRRSIGFVVGVDGLSVSAPRWVGLGEVEAALREKAGWILRKLHEQRERAQRLAAARVDWRDGSTIPFLGETVILVLDPRATGAELVDSPGAARRPPEGRCTAWVDRAVLNTAAQALPGVPRWTLHLGLPQTATPGQIRDTVQSWLQRQARRLFEERCTLFGRPPGRAHEAADAQFGLHALGQCQRRRVDPIELAPGALRPAGDRLRGDA